MELKKYLQNRTILFLNLAVILLSLYNILATVIKIDISRTTAILRYQPSLGLSGFEKNSTWQLYSFTLMAVLIALFGLFFAGRLYRINKLYSILVLSLTIVLLFFNIIVSEAILSIHNLR